MSETRRSHSAQTDLEEIWDYIALDNPNAADRLLERIGNRYDEYAARPTMGPLATRIDPSLPTELRWFPVGSYVVFYLPQDDGILVVRVLHGHRDIPQALRDQLTDEGASGQGPARAQSDNSLSASHEQLS